MDPDRWRAWHDPFKERICSRVEPFSHGTILRAPDLPAYWFYNSARIERPLDLEGVLAAAEAALADAPHRCVEWAVPPPADVLDGLRAQGWHVTRFIWMLHDGRPMHTRSAEIQPVEYPAVESLRETWHQEDFPGHQEDPAFAAQQESVFRRGDGRVLAALRDGEPIGFAQVLVHDGGAEIDSVYVLPEHRGAGLGTALTSHAITVAAQAAPDVWICADFDGRPRKLYERLGFRPMAETAGAVRVPR